MNHQEYPTRVLIAVEQPVFRRSLRNMLELERDFEILPELEIAGLPRFEAHRKPDALLVDLSLYRRLKAQHGDSPDPFANVRTLVMVPAVLKPDIVDAFRLGAHGIVLRNSSPDLLARSLRHIVAGSYWFDNQSLAFLVEVLRESLLNGNGDSQPRDYGLTPRELDIIAKIASGRSNREVGEAFSISERTVKHHLTNIFTKTGVTSRLQLALFAVNHRLMPNNHAALELDALHRDSEA